VDLALDPGQSQLPPTKRGVEGFQTFRQGLGRTPFEVWSSLPVSASEPLAAAAPPSPAETAHDGRHRRQGDYADAGGREAGQGH
jgi:hypothetical protein